MGIVLVSLDGQFHFPSKFLYELPGHIYYVANLGKLYSCSNFKVAIRLPISLRFLLKTDDRKTLWTIILLPVSEMVMFSMPKHPWWRVLE